MKEQYISKGFCPIKVSELIGGCLMTTKQTDEGVLKAVERVCRSFSTGAPVSDSDVELLEAWNRNLPTADPGDKIRALKCPNLEYTHDEAKS